MITKATKGIIVLFLFLAVGLSAQNRGKLLTLQNRILFGNYLFSSKDYLRAIDEYNSVLKIKWCDSLQFKIGLAYYEMGMFSSAISEYAKLKNDKMLIKQGQNEIFRSYYQIGNYTLLRNKIKSYFISNGKEVPLNRLYQYSLLLDNSNLPPKKKYLDTFEKNDRKKIGEFYDWKLNPPYKSPVKGAIMSAIIPGLGKIYADEVGDGITAFLFTGLFTYLSVNKFQNDYNAAGWLYASIAAFFYSGNIYGSYAAVQNYNVGLKFNFDKEVKLYLNEKSQYLSKPNY